MNPTRTITIGVLAYPGCLPTSAVIPLDVLRIANTIAALRPSSLRVHFEGLLVSARGAKPVAAGGVSLNPVALSRADIDALIVPGIEHRTAEDISTVLPTLAREQAALAEFAEDGKRLLASTCSGSCLVAGAGLLDGRRCTTSWWLAPYFMKEFPEVVLDAEELVVQDGQFLTSGGVTSALDLALWMVGHFGGEDLRQLTAKVLVTDTNRASQAPYVASAMMQGDGAVIERARRWINQRIGQAWTTEQLASHCNLSSRTLLRRFQDGLGVTPALYAQQLRVERAKALLETTPLSFEEITSRCGYEAVSTFSQVFKRWAQVTPGEYRHRFGLRR